MSTAVCVMCTLLYVDLEAGARCSPPPRALAACGAHPIQHIHRHSNLCSASLSGLEIRN